MKTYNIVCDTTERFEVMELIKSLGGKVTNSSAYYGRSIIHFECTEKQAESIERNL